MGVIRCDRHNCDNDISDHYSHNYGNLCSECFQELRYSKLSISKFLNTVPNRDNMETDRYEELRKEYDR